MKFNVRFAIGTAGKVGSRLGSGSSYTLRELCVSVVDRYSLSESEVCAIAALKPGESFRNEDMEVTRMQMTRQEHAAEAQREHQGQEKH